MPAPLLLPLLYAGALAVPSAQGGDERERYDVLTYRLDLQVDPSTRRIDGEVYVRARVVGEALDTLQLDLSDSLHVRSAREIRGPLPERSSPLGRAVPFEHSDDRLNIRLAHAYQEGEVVCVGVEYGGSPRSVDRYFGVHWSQSQDGRPWVSTSVQGIGSRTFWPCKDSFFHPEDKHEELFVNLEVPKGLVGVSNGRSTGRTPSGDSWETFHWVHPYACETYAVTLNVGPYLEVERPLELLGSEQPVPFVYYVLPEDAEKARMQFADVPEILSVFAESFGPWPFPKSKIGIVQANFLGMEHSTALAYGSSFPAWCKANGEPDPMADRNQLHDYVLVHELAHEWWGNAVSARDWGDFWIHEGFATYSEAVLVEKLHGRAKSDEFFQRMRSQVSADSRLYRGREITCEEAYGAVVYVKGAWILQTLRHYVDDDEAWWRTLREFNLRHRYGNASTEDFRAVLEEVTRENWERFFDEWFYGVGYPELSGEAYADGNSVVLTVENAVRRDTPFHVPIDLAWSEGEKSVRHRVSIQPGSNTFRIPCAVEPRSVQVLHLDRILGKHAIAVRDSN